MEKNNYQDNNIHELYPGAVSTDAVHTRDSWGVMLERLSTDLINLWEGQARLISTELSEKVTTIKIASSALLLGAVFMSVGVLCLAVTAIIALSNIVDPWIAAALVTVVLLAMGFFIIKGAQKKLVGRDLVPSQSLETLGQIKTTIQERVHEYKRQ